MVLLSTFSNHLIFEGLRSILSIIHVKHLKMGNNDLFAHIQYEKETISNAY